MQEHTPCFERVVKLANELTERPDEKFGILHQNRYNWKNWWQNQVRNKSRVRTDFKDWILNTWHDMKEDTAISGNLNEKWHQQTQKFVQKFNEKMYERRYIQDVLVDRIEYLLHNCFNLKQLHLALFESITGMKNNVFPHVSYQNFFNFYKGVFFFEYASTLLKPDKEAELMFGVWLLLEHWSDEHWSDWRMHNFVIGFLLLAMDDLVSIYYRYTWGSSMLSNIYAAIEPKSQLLPFRDFCDLRFKDNSVQKLKKTILHVYDNVARFINPSYTPDFVHLTRYTTVCLNSLEEIEEAEMLKQVREFFIERIRLLFKAWFNTRKFFQTILNALPHAISSQQIEIDNETSSHLLILMLDKIRKDQTYRLLFGIWLHLENFKINQYCIDVIGLACETMLAKEANLKKIWVSEEHNLLPLESFLSDAKIVDENLTFGEKLSLQLEPSSNENLNRALKFKFAWMLSQTDLETKEVAKLKEKEIDEVFASKINDIFNQTMREDFSSRDLVNTVCELRFRQLFPFCFEQRYYTNIWLRIFGFIKNKYFKTQTFDVRQYTNDINNNFVDKMLKEINLFPDESAMRLRLKIWLCLEKWNAWKISTRHYSYVTDIMARFIYHEMLMGLRTEHPDAENELPDFFLLEEGGDEESNTDDDDAQAGKDKDAQAGEDEDAQAGEDEDAQAGEDEDAQAGEDEDAQAGEDEDAQLDEDDFYWVSEDENLLPAKLPIICQRRNAKSSFDSSADDNMNKISKKIEEAMNASIKIWQDSFAGHRSKQSFVNWSDDDMKTLFEETTENILKKSKSKKWFDDVHTFCREKIVLLFPYCFKEKVWLSIFDYIEHEHSFNELNWIQKRKWLRYWTKYRDKDNKNIMVEAMLDTFEDMLKDVDSNFKSIVQMELNIWLCLEKWNQWKICNRRYSYVTDCMGQFMLDMIKSKLSDSFNLDSGESSKDEDDAGESSKSEQRSEEEEGESEEEEGESEEEEGESEEEEGESEEEEGESEEEEGEEEEEDEEDEVEKAWASGYNDKAVDEEIKEFKKKITKLIDVEDSAIKNSVKVAALKLEKLVLEKKIWNQIRSNFEMEEAKMHSIWYDMNDHDKYHALNVWLQNELNNFKSLSNTLKIWIITLFFDTLMRSKYYRYLFVEYSFNVREFEWDKNAPTNKQKPKIKRNVWSILKDKRKIYQEYKEKLEAWLASNETGPKPNTLPKEFWNIPSPWIDYYHIRTSGRDNLVERTRASHLWSTCIKAENVSELPNYKLLPENEWIEIGKNKKKIPASIIYGNNMLQKNIFCLTFDDQFGYMQPDQQHVLINRKIEYCTQMITNKLSQNAKPLIEHVTKLAELKWQKIMIEKQVWLHICSKFAINESNDDFDVDEEERYNVVNTWLQRELNMFTNLSKYLKIWIITMFFDMLFREARYNYLLTDYSFNLLQFAWDKNASKDEKKKRKIITNVWSILQEKREEYQKYQQDLRAWFDNKDKASKPVLEKSFWHLPIPWVAKYGIRVSDEANFVAKIRASHAWSMCVKAPKLSDLPNYQLMHKDLWHKNKQNKAIPQSIVWGNNMSCKNNFLLTL